MATIRVTVSVEVDGAPAPGFPYVRRINGVDLESFNYAKQVDGTDVFERVPIEQLNPASVVALITDREVTVRLASQTDQGVVLEPGGLVLVVGGSVAAFAPLPLASVNNVSGAAARIKGIAAGT